MSRIIRIAGELTLDTVAARENEIASALAAGEPVLTLDLSGIRNADSSSLPLLLCWLRQARQHRVKLSLTGLPAAMQQLIEVYDLHEPLANSQ